MRRPPAWWLAVVCALLVAGCGALKPAEEAAQLLEVWMDWGQRGAALGGTECGGGVGGPWSPTTPPCGLPGNTSSAWRGIKCSEDGQVTEINLSQCGLRGSLPAKLGTLSMLQTLDLSQNSLSGRVPRDWVVVGAFRSLATLQLARNQLTGALSDFTPAVSGFIASLAFNVSRNQLSQGTVPSEWYSKTLQLIDISWQGNLTGPLPVEWGLPKELHEEEYPSALPSLARLALEGNNLTGSFDPWPGGGKSVFSPNFLCTGRPGNPLLGPALYPPTSGSSGGGLSAGAIAGIAVGCVAAAAVAALAAFALVRRRRKQAVQAAHPADGGGSKAGDDRKGGDDVEKAGGSAQDLQTDGSQGRGGPRQAGGISSIDMSDSARLSSLAPPSMGSAGRSAGTPGSGHMPRSPFADSSSRARFSPQAVTPDTDASQLPSDWNMVEFSELEIAKVLGKGSFGTVVLAKYCHTMVAVKMLGDDKAPGSSDSMHRGTTMRQFGKEVAVMSKLRHTNVCLYMGACLDPPCLVLEYCARQSLDLVLAQGLRDPQLARHLRWPRLLSIALGAARGMAYLHSRQPAIYHRDLKAANLLLTSSWAVKVADFNLSRFVEESEFHSTLCIQNPRWLAPEVLGGQMGGLPADVWSFGTVLYELATWRAPFEGVNPYQIINTVLDAPHGSGLAVPAPHQLPAGPLAAYAEYVSLMEDCWTRQPEQRPTFNEVAERLQAILQIEVRQTSPGLSTTSSKAASSLPSPYLTTQHSLAATGAQPGPALLPEPEAGQQIASSDSGGGACPPLPSTEDPSQAVSQAYAGELGGGGMSTPFAATSSQPRQ